MTIIAEIILGLNIVNLLLMIITKVFVLLQMLSNKK